MITEFSLPGAVTVARLVVGPDGALWFIEQAGNILGRMTRSGQVTTVLVPPVSSAISQIPVVFRDLAVGQDGALWFSDSNNHTIRRMTPSGVVTSFPVPGMPGLLVAGADGALWFSDLGRHAIGRLMSGGAVQEFTLPSDFSRIGAMTRGPEGLLWFADAEEAGLWTISPGGIIRQVSLPAPVLVIRGLVGSDGMLWWTEGQRIGEMREGGQMTAVRFPNGTDASQIVVGPARSSLVPMERCGSRSLNGIRSGAICPEFIAR